MAERVSCAATSLAIDEPLRGTAPRASAWLLIEQPGAWGAKALTESGLDREIGAVLDVRAKEAGAKALLVKRTDRASRGDSRRAFVCSPAPGAAFVEEIHVEDPAALLEIDLGAVTRGERPRLGPLLERPLYLVCTNGRRDACCARLGVPVRRALEAARPGSVWECSHIGGHRYAANVVCLPDGVCYGRVSATAAPELAEMHERGELELDAYRGRASLSPAAQAGEAFLREARGITRLAGLSLLDSSNGGSTFATADGDRFRVEVAVSPGPLRPASCGQEVEPSERFELVSLEQLASG